MNCLHALFSFDIISLLNSLSLTIGNTFNSTFVVSSPVLNGGHG